MNTYLIIAIAVALILAVACADRIKDALGMLWFLTIGVWIEVFKGNNASTGNGAGMMGTLLCLVVIGLQLVALLIGGIIWLIHHLAS